MAEEVVGFVWRAGWFFFFPLEVICRFRWPEFAFISLLSGQKKCVLHNDIPTSGSVGTAILGYCVYVFRVR